MPDQQQLDLFEWANTCTPSELIEGFIPMIRVLWEGYQLQVPGDREKRDEFFEIIQNRKHSDPSFAKGFIRAMDLLSDSREVGLAIWSKANEEQVAAGIAEAKRLRTRFDQEDATNGKA